jgi:hypothetical protein
VKHLSVVETCARARLSQWTWDGLRAAPFVLALLFASEKEARAYADPGSGTLIWQIVAAGFVGLLFYLRKFTSWFKGRKGDAKD